jgi:hypothetical protein
LYCSSLLNLQAGERKRSSRLAEGAHETLASTLGILTDGGPLRADGVVARRQFPVRLVTPNAPGALVWIAFGTHKHARERDLAVPRCCIRNPGLVGCQLYQLSICPSSVRWSMPSVAVSVKAQVAVFQFSKIGCAIAGSTAVITATAVETRSFGLR